MTLEEAVKIDSMVIRLKMMKSISDNGLSHPTTKLYMIELREAIKLEEEMNQDAKIA